MFWLRDNKINCLVRTLNKRPGVSKSLLREYLMCLLVLMLYVPANNFSAVLGCFPGLNQN